MAERYEVEVVNATTPEPTGYMVGRAMLAELETEARDRQAEARLPYDAGYAQAVLDTLYWITNRGVRPYGE